MTTQEILQHLESLGTEQTRKTLRRHGAGDNLYGVLYSDLYKLQKRIKVNHTLARELWQTGNHDARVFALLIADPQGLTDADAEAWIADANNTALSSAVGTLVSRSPLAQQKAEQWGASPEEWRGCAGWTAVAGLTREGTKLPDSFFEALLGVIEREIHSRPNRTRSAMNSTLISIGLRNEVLREKALAAAARIGKVEVDHGDTSCKTPDAASYILHAVERKASRKK